MRSELRRKCILIGHSKRSTSQVSRMRHTLVGTNDFSPSKSSTALLAVDLPSTYIRIRAASTRRFRRSSSTRTNLGSCLFRISIFVPSAEISLLGTRHRGHGQAPRFFMHAKRVLLIVEMKHRTSRGDVRTFQGSLRST